MKIRRREFLALGSAGLVAAQQGPRREIVAGATQDVTPRVGIVLSSFKRGEDHDGTPIEGLKEPQPPTADLTSAQIDAMVRRAIELGSTRAAELATVVEAEDWVVIKTHVGAWQPYVPGTVVDPRVVRAVISFLAERKRGLRFTVVDGPSEWQLAEKTKSTTDGWSSDWGGAFDGLSYRKMIDECSRRFPSVKCEIVDLNFADSVELPVPGGASARHNPAGAYTIPKIIQECDRVISIAPFETDAATGVSLSMGNYLGIAPGSTYGFPKDGLLKLGSPDDVAIDLFSYHPADFAIVGGCWGLEGGGGDGAGAASVHHNVVVAGLKAGCVDAVAAAIMGFKPVDLPLLALAEKKGFGTRDVDMIWTRGNEIEEAARRFRHASGWQPAGSGKGAA